MPVDFVAEEFDAHGVLGVGGAKLDRVAAHAEFAARELEIVALVLHFDQPREEVFAGEELALRHGADHVLVILGRAQAVDARDAGDDETSRRVSSELVAARRRRSISSLMLESFSM